MARQRVPGRRTHWPGLSDRAWGVPHPRDGLPPGLQRRHWAPTPSAELWPMGGTLPGLPMAARLRALVTSADCALCGSERELESRGEPEMPMKTRPAVQPMNVFLGGFFRTRPRSLVHPSGLCSCHHRPTSCHECPLRAGQRACRSEPSAMAPSPEGDRQGVGESPHGQHSGRNPGGFF